MAFLKRFLESSIVEGWPTAIVKALACGLPIVSTNVSGVKEMIDTDINSFIAYNKNDFAKYYKSFGLPSPNRHSLEKAKNYSISRLKTDLYKFYGLHENN